MIYIKRILFMLFHLPLGIIMALWFILQILISPIMAILVYIIKGDSSIKISDVSIFDFIPEYMMKLYNILNPDIHK